jgi:hypothetical protein
MYAANAPRSSSVQYSDHWRWNRTVSTTVSMRNYTPPAHSLQTSVKTPNRR